MFGVFRVRQKALHRRIRLLRVCNGSLRMFIIANVEFGLRHAGEGEAGRQFRSEEFDPVLIGLGLKVRRVAQLSPSFRCIGRRFVAIATMQLSAFSVPLRPEASLFPAIRLGNPVPAKVHMHGRQW